MPVWIVICFPGSSIRNNKILFSCVWVIDMYRIFQQLVSYIRLMDVESPDSYYALPGVRTP